MNHRENICEKFLVRFRSKAEYDSSHMETVWTNPAVMSGGLSQCTANSACVCCHLCFLSAADPPEWQIKTLIRLVHISTTNKENKEFIRKRFSGVFIVLAGIILGQAVLYGPSLTGNKILLPLDILAQSGVYIPQTAETAGLAPHNMILSDLVYQFEPARQFAVSEIHHGRFPLWAPYQYGGVPFVWPKYSPFLFLECLAKSPVILAWVQLLAAMVAGVGMYFFCRKALAGQLLAGNRLRLVLSIDGLFCPLAGISHRAGGLLVAVAFSGS